MMFFKIRDYMIFWVERNDHILRYDQKIMISRFCHYLIGQDRVNHRVRVRNCHENFTNVASSAARLRQSAPLGVQIYLSSTR